MKEKGMMGKPWVMLVTFREMLREDIDDKKNEDTNKKDET